MLIKMLYFAFDEFTGDGVTNMQTWLFSLVRKKIAVMIRIQFLLCFQLACTSLYALCGDSLVLKLPSISVSVTQHMSRQLDREQAHSEVVWWAEEQSNGMAKKNQIHQSLLKRGLSVLCHKATGSVGRVYMYQTTKDCDLTQNRSKQSYLHEQWMYPGTWWLYRSLYNLGVTREVTFAQRRRQ